MAKQDERVRVEIGFEGGHVKGLAVTPAALQAFEKALAAQEATHELEADDGHYIIALAQVVYVKRFARESRVGF